MICKKPRILVTGGTRGIGLACVRALAHAGCSVLVHGRADVDRVRKVAADLPGEGHEALAFDLADPSSVAAAAAELVAGQAPLHGLVNNAGVYEPHPPLETAGDELAAAWRRHIAVNLDGPALLTLALLGPLTAAGGRVVNVTSRGAFRGEPECPAYGAAKAGLNSFTQSLAVALAPRGVTCLAVAPGWVETDMTRNHLAGPEGPAIRSQSPLGRVSTAEEVAAVVRYALLEAPDAMTGAILDVNGASYLRS